jgi:hypothetical protein
MSDHSRPVLQIIAPEPTSDGAGVRLLRVLGGQAMDRLDPFLLLDHFGSDDPNDYMAGFPMHPHRGIETVTYMLKGRVRHRDSLGNEGVIEAGDVQWMTAAGGILHEEMPEHGEGGLAGFQLWVNLPGRSKRNPPRYRNLSAEKIPLVENGSGATIRVVAGRIGKVRGPVDDVEADPTYLDVTLDAGATFRHPVPDEHNAFTYLFRGSARFGGEEISASRLVVFGDRRGGAIGGGEGAVAGGSEDDVVAEAGAQGARFLLVAGAPLGEPVARYGPIVMNTRAEVMEALRDLEQGTFVR